MEEAMTLATLVGLLCNWKQDRGSEDQDRFQDFITWLTHHNFNKLRDQILESNDLQVQLNGLLHLDLAEIDGKLDILTSIISSIAGRLDHFDAIAKTLNSPTDEISDQAAGILLTFYTSGQKTMLVLPTQNQTTFYLWPSGQQFSVREERFLDDDLKTLVETGLLQVAEFDNRGNPKYGITRSGAKWVSALAQQPK